VAWAGWRLVDQQRDLVAPIATKQVEAGLT
jgi:hypothetical protein